MFPCFLASQEALWQLCTHALFCPLTAEERGLNNLNRSCRWTAAGGFGHSCTPAMQEDAAHSPPTHGTFLPSHQLCQVKVPPPASTLQGHQPDQLSRSNKEKPLKKAEDGNEDIAMNQPVADLTLYPQSPTYRLPKGEIRPQTHSWF